MGFDARNLARAVSRVIGWTYVICWSLSFYPQPILNWRRKSTLGLAIDFPTSNTLGFICYTVSNGAFLFSPVIRSQYAARHPEAPNPTVRYNDFAFALHGAILCVVTYSQFFPRIWGFKVGAMQRASMWVKGIVWGSIVGIVVLSFVVATQGKNGGYTTDPTSYAWIDVVYGISIVKLIVTFIKYIPQAYLNFKRKSTKGWAIGQILLDFAGGVLSLLQLFIDAGLQKDWSGISGNPAKLLLSNISIVFDLIFITQHYWFYRNAPPEGKMEGDEDAEDERSPLIHGEV